MLIVIITTQLHEMNQIMGCLNIPTHRNQCHFSSFTLSGGLMLTLTWVYWYHYIYNLSDSMFYNELMSVWSYARLEL